MAEIPLLQAFWADVEAAEVSTDENLSRCPSAHELQQQYPNQLIQFLKQHGVKKLGEAKIPATELPGLFGDESLLTRGSKSCTFDWIADWGVTPDEEHEEDLPAPTFPVPAAAAAAERNRAERPLAARSVGLPFTSAPWTSRYRTTGPLGRLSSGILTCASSFIAPLTSTGAQAALQRPPPSLPPPPSVVIEAYLVAVRDAAAAGEAGLLRPLLRRWQLGSCSASAFGLPAVQAVVHYKWTRYAQRLLLMELALYGLWLGSFTGFMALYNTSDAATSNHELLKTWQGCLAIACEAVALLAMLPFAAGEVCIIHAHGFVSWLSAWNMLDCATYTLQIAITALHLGLFTDGPTLLMLAVAVQAILLVVRLTYFSRVFKSTTFDLMGSLQSVAADVGWYMAVLILLMWGFACAFYTIFRDDAAADSFSSLPMSLLTMLNYAVGGTSYYMRGLLASREPAAAILLCTVYQFLVSMLLMSLLTGVMTNSLMKANQQEAVLLVLNRAQVIDELDTVLPGPFLRILTSYGRPADSPRGRPWRAARTPSITAARSTDSWLPYIHVLRVSPKSLDSIDGEEKLWPLAAGGAQAGGSANGGGGGASMSRNVSHTSLAGRDVADVAAAQGEAAGSQEVKRLEDRVRRLEGRMSELHASMHQLLEVNNNIQAMLIQQQQQQQQQQQHQQGQQCSNPGLTPCHWAGQAVVGMASCYRKVSPWKIQDQIPPPTLSG